MNAPVVAFPAHLLRPAAAPTLNTPPADRYTVADLHGEALILRGQDAARYVLAQLLEEV